MRSGWRRWAAGGGVVVVGAALAVAVATPSFIRRRIVARAAARGVIVSVGTVRLGWGRVRLDGLSVGLEGVDHLRAQGTGAVLGFGPLGLHDDVAIDSLTIDVEGSPDTIRSELEGWRARHAGSDPGQTTGRGRTVRIDQLHLRWDGGAVAHAEVSAGVEVAPSRVVVRRGEGTLRAGAWSASFTGLETEVARASQQLASATLGSLTLAVDDPTGDAPSASEAAGSQDSSLAQPTLATGGERVWTALARVEASLERARGHVAVGAELRVDRLTFGSARGSLGPWSTRLTLGPDATSFELLPADTDGRKPLVVRALIPRDHGKWSAELQVGPATLAEVGVHEGAFGLVDVARASAEARGSIELDPDDKTFAADATLELRDASFADPRVADDTVTGLALGVHGVVTSRDDFRAWSLSGGSFALGKLRIEVDGTYESRPADAKGRPGHRVGGRWNVPVVACADALGSLPTSLIPKLTGMSMDGTFGAHGSIGYDTAALDKTQLEFFVDQRCRITHAPPSLAVERFRGPFELRVYDPTGKPGSIETFGPGTPGWASYAQISPYVGAALLTSEDGAFFSHNGFSPISIRNAIVANLKSGKFALGASTITMQLAKNVYLDRRKQLARKVQEAVLTAWLEQSMTKTELLELYLNVIEFGPNLYGIGPAAWHYFGRPPSDLDPVEATFLVSILPSPVRRHAMWDAGAVSEGYLAYLRSLLREEHRRGHLDDDELADALGRPLVFHKPGMPAPEPHVIKKDGGTIQIHDDPTKAPSDFDPVWAPQE